MICPHHHKSLRLDRRGRARFHRCPECAGLWLPGVLVGEVLGVDRAAELRRIGQEAPPSALVCPLDGGRMTAPRLSGVTVDYCLSCSGLWLDWGELRLLERRRASHPRREPASGRPEEEADAIAVILELLGEVLFSLFH